MNDIQEQKFLYWKRKLFRKLNKQKQYNNTFLKTAKTWKGLKIKTVGKNGDTPPFGSNNNLIVLINSMS